MAKGLIRQQPGTVSADRSFTIEIMVELSITCTVQARTAEGAFERAVEQCRKHGKIGDFEVSWAREEELKP
jgi:hypothetical protein